MEASVLSKNQQKKAIKKGKKIKKSVRHVLSKPKTIKWPEISEEESKNLHDKLKNILYHTSNIKVDWNLLKNIPRDQRKETRDNIAKMKGKQDKPEEMQNIIFGINAVTRGLEKKIITSVLISSDVNPVDLIKHIWYSCDNSHIPFVAVQNLRYATKDILGFPVLAMGLKKTGTENPLYAIYEIISELDTQFTGRSYPYTETINLDDIIMDDDEEILLKNKKNIVKSTKILDDKDIYLYRTTEERCFIPPKSNNNISSHSLDWNTDFIQFNDDLEPDNTNKTKKTNNSKVKRNKKSRFDQIKKSPEVNSTKNIASRLTNMEIDTQISSSKSKESSNTQTVTTNGSQTKKLPATSSLDDSVIFISEDTVPVEPTLNINNRIDIMDDSNSSDTSSLLKSLDNEIELREKGHWKNTLKSLGKVISNGSDRISGQNSPKNRNAKKKELKKLRNSGAYLPVQVKRLQANPNKKRRK